MREDVAIAIKYGSWYRWQWANKARQWLLMKVYGAGPTVGPPPYTLGGLLEDYIRDNKKQEPIKVDWDAVAIATFQKWLSWQQQNGTPAIAETAEELYAGFEDRYVQSRLIAAAKSIFTEYREMRRKPAVSKGVS